jgi:hypothetical protein
MNTYIWTKTIEVDTEEVYNAAAAQSKSVLRYLYDSIIPVSAYKKNVAIEENEDINKFVIRYNDSQYRPRYYNGN